MRDRMVKKGYRLAHEASAVVSDEYVGLLSRDEYNAAVLHVGDLINASYVLFKSGNFAPSVFLSITVYEEIAKIKAGHMRSWGGERAKVTRSRDPLFHHGTKHRIAVAPLYLIGDRISKTIGPERAKEFFSLYESGDYSRLREESLYFSRTKDALHIPSRKIDSRLAAEHLVVAIEIFCDEFWGMTSEASERCDATNDWYADIEGFLEHN